MCICDPKIKGARCKNCAEDGKGPGGAPSKYDELDLKQVERLALLGWTDYAMHTFFGVVHSTWYKWKSENKALSDILKKWKDNKVENIERSMYERAMGYSHPEDKIFKSQGEEPTIIKTTKHYPPDQRSGEFLLRVYDPEKYNIKTGVQISGDKEQPLEHNLNVKEQVKEAMEDFNKNY